MSENSAQLENIKKHINFTYAELKQVAECLGAFSLQIAADPLKAAEAIQTIELGAEVRRRQLKTGLHEAFDRQRLVWLLDELRQLCASKRQLEKSMGREPELFPWQVRGLG
ncbi:MAG: hypothetical protein HY234_03755 [Acidobacteria bacterium]|nr:hypothetical protein [Acidobacteriota bacterium]MBI3662152.1 hypothetical protein [Acidobacteriota bacterium]